MMQRVRDPRKKRLLIVVIAVYAVLLAVVLAVVVAWFLQSQPQESNLLLAMTGSEYRFEDPGYLFHSSIGRYYLAIALTAENLATGPGSISSAELRLNTTLGVYEHPVMRPSSVLTIPAGFTQAFVVVFTVNATDSGYRVEYKSQAVAVPAPPPPPPEFDMHLDNATQNSEDNNGFPADPGYVFLWVNLTFTNYWHDNLEINTFYFLLEAIGGVQYNAHSKLGPNAIAPGGSSLVTVIWEIPTTATPSRIIFDQIFGPWGTTAIP